MINYYLHASSKEDNSISIIPNANNECDLFVSKHNVDFCKNSILPHLDIIFSHYSKKVSFKQGISISVLNDYLNLLNNYSEEFNLKLKKELSTLNISQLELFLELASFNKKINPKFNPLIDVLRIKNGVITNKVFFKKFSSVCDKTYDGFLRAISSGAFKFIKAKFKSKNVNLIVKSNSGYNKYGKIGTNILGMEPKTLDVYVINSENVKGKITHSVKKASSGLSDYIFISFSDLQKKIAKNPSYNEFYNVFEVGSKIKTSLMAYSNKKVKTNITNFKHNMKKLTQDKKARKVIKNRFKK
jgi:hypothetical protein